MADDEELHEKAGKEAKEVEERSSPGGHIVYQAVHKEGEDELERNNSALAWSGLAAGLSMGFSLMSEGLIRSHLADTPWRILFTKFGYSIGFLVVILARQQLFTENTLTVILPLLRKRDARTFINVVRLWSIVLVANLVGAFIVAWVMGHTNALEPNVRQAMKEIGLVSMNHDFITLMVRGIFAGWLIALMVWLLPFAETARVGVIIIVTWVVGIGEFSHIVAGSVDAFYLVATGVKTFGQYFVYMVPILIGNIIGGSSIVATIAHAQYVGSGDSKTK
ncbi:MAG: formate/nitrite transporter family protein [Chthoniobacterales bacterium]